MNDFSSFQWVRSLNREKQKVVTLLHIQLTHKQEKYMPRLAGKTNLSWAVPGSGWDVFAPERGITLWRKCSSTSFRNASFTSSSTLGPCSMRSTTLSKHYGKKLYLHIIPVLCTAQWTWLAWLCPWRSKSSTISSPVSPSSSLATQMNRGKRTSCRIEVKAGWYNWAPRLWGKHVTSLCCTRTHKLRLTYKDAVKPMNTTTR